MKNKNLLPIVFLSTGANPDYHGIISFKDSLREYLRKGYKTKGEIIKGKDGNMSQELVRSEEKR